MQLKLLIIPVTFFFTTVVLADTPKKITHQHGSRSHSHVLPEPAGLSHSHNGKAQQVIKKSSTESHYHGDRKHSHPLPLIGYAHKHGMGEYGTLKKTAEPAAKAVVAVTPAPTTTTSTVRFKCSEIPRSTAQALLSMGHGYLDRDNDGDACEPHNFPGQKPYTPSASSSSGSNCHWVSGYTRKNGSRVRGHSRCR